jgi:TonB family protein
MRRMLAVGTMLSVFAAGAWAQGDAQKADTDEWGKLVAANNLDVKGNTPFHLGMKFQLYDLDGKPTETGSFETWWTAPGKHRTVVHLAGLNEDGRFPAGADAASVRNSYLVRKLLESTISPLPVMLSPQEVSTRSVKFGKVQLDCIGPKSSLLGLMNAQPTTACVAPNTTDVLFLEGLGGKMTLLRPKTGTFHDTHVALDLRLAILGKDAIAGTMTVLEGDSSKAVEPPAADASEARIAPVSGGVIAGKRIKFVEPVYPAAAKIARLSGAVLLSAIIGVDGSVRRLAPIASTDRMFTDEAMDAVKKWKYSPYLLNGEPTEVDTTITVNFSLYGG